MDADRSPRAARNRDSAPETPGWRIVLPATLFFFCLLCGYYILRPVREDMGIAGGVRNLPYLYLATLTAMLLVAPLFGAVVRRWRREIFVPAFFHFFAANLLIFFVLLRWLQQSAQVDLGRVFYVWVSVFNLFIVSLFWSYLADGLGLELSKRLFGYIAVGGTAGAWLGGVITDSLAAAIGRSPLLLVSAGFLEIGVVCAHLLARRLPQADPGPGPLRPPIPSPRADAAVAVHRREGSNWDGVLTALRSPYLLAVAGYLFLYSLTSTFAYFEQANIIARQTLERTARVALFARIDIAVNSLTLATQLFLTGRIIRRIGTGWTLAALPLITVGGFLALGLAPALTVLIVFQVLRRASNYALAKPARETLFAILDRKGVYMAKNFLDTFVRRGGDAVGAGAFSLLTRIGIGLGGAAFVAIPFALIWSGMALFLGREQSRQGRARADYSSVRVRANPARASASPGANRNASA